MMKIAIVINIYDDPFAGKCQRWPRSTRVHNITVVEYALSNNLRPFLFLDYLWFAAFHSNFHPEAMQLFIIERLCGCALRLHVSQETLNAFVALAQVANREDPLRDTSSTERSTRPTLQSACV